MDPLDIDVSLADIARLADVHKPAVSNWRRRYREFPRPTSSIGPEVFRARDIVAWLDRRGIAKDDLKQGERPGMTYGERFRRNLGIPTNIAGRREDVGAILWTEMARYRGLVEVGAIRDAVLALLYLNARDRSG